MQVAAGLPFGNSALVNVSDDVEAGPGSLRLLRLWSRFCTVVRPNELQITLFWAGLIGFSGACLSVLFRWLTQVLHRVFTQGSGGYVETFAHLAWWQRLLVPAVGGLLAGWVLHFGQRIKAGKSSTDYMEAIVLGDGVLSFRQSLIKCSSALLSISSGASIGREGPIVQLAAMTGSLLGRLRKMPAVRLRLLVACGGAAGIAAAYNAPIAGALFVSEVVLRSLSMESFGPLVFASVISTLTVRQFLGGTALYEIAIPSVRLNSNWEMLLYLLLGVLAGGVAPLFLWSLRSCEKLFARVALPGYLRLFLGGLSVGALALWHPEVCGNGYSVVNNILHGSYFWPVLLTILLCKWLATALTFGSGAVGGVFTPTIFVGAGGGALFAQAVQTFWPGTPLVPAAFTLVGMGALLAGTTHAPIMAIIMLFELTLDYQIILPLMLACVVAHYVSLAFEPKSIYAESLKRKGAGQFQLQTMRVDALMNKQVPTVHDTASFAEIVEHFISSRHTYLYVLDPAGAFRGAISLHDVKSSLSDPNLARIVIAEDLVQEPFPTLHPDTSLSDALEKFSHHEGDRLPVVERQASHRLLGSISKTDLLLALAESTRQESTPHVASV